MVKSKRQKQGFAKPQSLSPRERGLQAFNNSRFHEAIVFWAPLSQDEHIRAALAEAYFRRALIQPPENATPDIQHALLLAPNDLRYAFHLGRMFHMQGNLKAADEQYRKVLAQDPTWEAATRLLILLTLQQNPRADLNDLPGMNPVVKAWIAPIQQLLQGEQPAPGSTPLARFWHGLGLLTNRDATAVDVLSDSNALPHSPLNVLRRYYHGVALAQHERWDEALALWQRDASNQNAAPAHALHQNLGAMLYAQVQKALEQDLASAAALAYQWRHISGGAAFDELWVSTLDQGAQQAARLNNWTLAIQYWEAAREIVGRSKALGSPRNLLHNLALAYEQVEAWLKAAEAWRALLRVRPRQRGDDPQEQSRWAWVRSRIIECYKRANRPDEAVTVFRQAIKSEPKDLDMRIQLADALLANQQERSAQNELERILEIDPKHADALLRKASLLIPRWYYADAVEIVRQVVKYHPERPDVLRSAAMLYMTLGRSYAQYGNYQDAYAMFAEGEPLDTQNFLFPLNQARMLQVLAKPQKHDELVERAITLAGNNTQAWSLILETWAMAKKLPQAQAMLERFEREQQPEAEDWMMMGSILLQRIVPPPAPSNPFGMLGLFGDVFGKPQIKETPPPEETPWTRMVLDIFQRVAALKPNNHDLMMAIASLLMLPFSTDALRYVELAVRAKPEDVDTLITLGMIQGLAGQVPAAKDTLQKASQLAKRQKQRDLQDQANEMRRMVGTPGFRAMVESQMYAAQMMDELDASGFGPDDFDDEDFEDFM